jgi:hypothetical protein
MQGVSAKTIATVFVMRPKPAPVPLLRIGGEWDGAYLVPDDLGDVAACFSPGVNNWKTFEDELVNVHGIACHMCDHSSDVEAFATPLIEGRQTFLKKWLDVTGATDSIALADWVAMRAPGTADLLLQMDIEGAEYRNLLGTPDDVLRRFRIVVLELHGLEAALDPDRFEERLGPLLRKLDRHFLCVHAHPNNCCGEVMLPGTGMNLPRVIELTFLRRDRFPATADRAWPTPVLPHPLDIRRNVDAQPPLFLNHAWSDAPAEATRIKRLEDELDYYRSGCQRLQEDSWTLDRIYAIGQGFARAMAATAGRPDREPAEVALGKRYRLSSSYGGYPVAGVVADSTPFFFHTGFGVAEGITIDLAAEHEITSIVVGNRTDICQSRGRYLFYSVHAAAEPDRTSGLPLAIGRSFWEGSGGSIETVVPQLRGRYVTIFTPEHTAVHLSSVRIHGVPTGAAAPSP